MTHHAWFGANFAERVMALVKPTRVVVYGNPNDEVKTALKDFGAAYMGADRRLRALEEAGRHD